MVPSVVPFIVAHSFFGREGRDGLTKNLFENLGTAEKSAGTNQSRIVLFGFHLPACLVMGAKQCRLGAEKSIFGSFSSSPQDGIGTVNWQT